MELRIDVDLEHIEDKAAIVNKGKEHHDVGDEKARHEVAQEAIGDEGKGYIASNEGDKAKEVGRLGAELYAPPIEQGKVGHYE